MKQHLPLITFFFLTLVFGLLSSCGKDDPVPGASPTLTVTANVFNGSTLSNQGQAIATDTIDFFFNVEAPAGFNSVLIGGSGNSAVTRADVGVAEGTTTVTDATFRVFTTIDDGEASASYTFVAIDDLGQSSDSVWFSFQIRSIVDTFRDITLGGFEHTNTGGYLNTIENVVYSLTNGILNSGKVDLLFYHNSTQGYTIGSLDDSNADATIENQTPTGDLDNFPTQNQTRFKTFSGAIDFDGVRAMNELENAYSSNASATDLSAVPNLSNNRVFGFQLANARANRIGLIKVNQTTGSTGSNRAIRIDVKVEPQ